jgi:hypothetical protein
MLLPPVRPDLCLLKLPHPVLALGQLRPRLRQRRVPLCAAALQRGQLALERGSARGGGRSLGCAGAGLILLHHPGGGVSKKAQQAE